MPPQRYWEAALLLALATTLPPTVTRSAAQSLSSVSAAFLDVGTGARGAALGGTGAAGRDGLESIALNPAAAAGMGRFEAAFTYRDQFGMLGYGRAQVGMKLGTVTAIALSLSQNGDDALTETTAGLTLARAVGRLAVGVEGRLLMARYGRNALDPDALSVFTSAEIAAGQAAQVQGDAAGFSVGVGARYAVGRAALGVSLRNLAAPVTWDSKAGGRQTSYNEAMAPEVVVGAEIPGGDAGLVVLELRPALDQEMDDVLRFGLEWTVGGILSVRGGTERFFNGRSDDRYTAGFGLALPPTAGFRLMAGYAYADSFLGASQEVTIRLVLP